MTIEIQEEVLLAQPKEVIAGMTQNQIKWLNDNRPDLMPKINWTDEQKDWIATHLTSS